MTCTPPNFCLWNALRHGRIPRPNLCIAIAQMEPSAFTALASNLSEWLAHEEQMLLNTSALESSPACHLRYRKLQ